MKELFNSIRRANDANNRDENDEFEFLNVEHACRANKCFDYFEICICSFKFDNLEFYFNLTQREHEHFILLNSR